ncbi:MAG: MarR family transcriptional regulator [Sphingomicrobium sp.]
MKHSALEANERVDVRVREEARGVRDRLQHLLKSLDELAEPEQVSDPTTMNHVRGILRSRRLRDRFFEASLFADPAWDILLELYAAELGQYQVSVSSLCIGAAVPPTTALRWIKTLEQKGLLVRRADPHDGRRIFMEISAEASHAMEGLFKAVPASGALI